MKKFFLLLTVFWSVFAFSANWYEGIEVSGYERYMSNTDMSGWFNFPAGYRYFAIWLDANPAHSARHGHALFLKHACGDHTHAPEGHRCPEDEVCFYSDNLCHRAYSFKGTFPAGKYWFWFDNGDFQIFRKKIVCITPVCYHVVCQLCQAQWCGYHQTHDECRVCPNLPDCEPVMCQDCNFFICAVHTEEHICEPPVIGP